LSKFPESIEDYRLAYFAQEDALIVKQWRNEQVAVLRQDHLLTDREQINYYNNVIKPLFEMDQPEQILFSYHKKNELIGYGGLTHIDWVSCRAEISFLLATDRTKDHDSYGQEFSRFLKLLKRTAFNELGLNRLYTETFDLRPWHVEVLEKNNFRFEGRLKQHVLIEDRYIDSLMHGCLKEYEYA
jgi:RimJ/RimL family protein N-acetyltransferase